MNVTLTLNDNPLRDIVSRIRAMPTNPTLDESVVYAAISEYLFWRYRTQTLVDVEQVGAITRTYLTDNVSPESFQAEVELFCGEYHAMVQHVLGIIDRHNMALSMVHHWQTPVEEPVAMLVFEAQPKDIEFIDVDVLRHYDESKRKSIWDSP